MQASVQRGFLVYCKVGLFCTLLRYFSKRHGGNEEVGWGWTMLRRWGMIRDLVGIVLDITSEDLAFGPYLDPESIQLNKLLYKHVSLFNLYYFCVH